jgi:thioredoxin 1
MKEHTGPELITRDEFDSNIVGGKGAVVVDIWAEWCGPCRLLAPFLHKLAAEHEGLVRVVKLGYDDNRDLKPKYGFRGIPALLFFNDGELVDMVVGFGNYDGLRKPFVAFVEKVTEQATLPASSFEQEFVAADKAAELAHDQIDKAARAEFFSVFGPANRNAKRTIARAEKALAAGKIDEAEKNRRVDRANEKLKAVSEPAQNSYSVTMKPVTAAYIRAIEAAAGIFVETQNTQSEGKFCKIGDPSCSG